MTENEIFNIIKYFKKSVPILSAGTHLVMEGRKNYVIIISHVDNFSILYSKLEYQDDEFFKWIKGKKVEMEMDTFVLLRQITKKRIVSADIGDDYFTIHFNDKDENPQEFKFTQVKKFKDKYDSQFDKVDEVISDAGSKVELDTEELFSDSMFLLYATETNDLIHERTDDLVLETATSRIKSLGKKRDSFVMATERGEFGRSVSISSVDDKYPWMSYHQIFNTI